jgi:thiol-disulfide isomerase/thioredoxin
MFLQHLLLRQSLLSRGLFVALLLAGTSLLQAQDRLPDIELTDMNGQRVNLSSYGESGEITVINFWATWCTPCKKELNNIVDLYPDWQEDFNVRVVAISIDDSRNKAKVKSYVNGQAWDYDVLLDVNGVLKQKLNFQTIPFTVVVDAEGNIVDRHSGYVDGDEYLLEEKLAELAAKE